MDKIYLCIDLRTFYASVECVERNLNPYDTDLVVADLDRGSGAICLAISPKMKKRGIKNRCRIWEIPKNINPIIVRPRMRKYIEYSAKIYGIYLKYVSKDDIHPYSIDEVFIDITSYLKLYKMTMVEFAKMLMKDIYFSFGIASSAGIGTNLYLAKVALDIIAKNNKSHIGFLNEELYKKCLWHYKPLTDFWNIGKSINDRLHILNLNDMCDIANCDEKILYKEFGINAKYLIDHSFGIEPCTISDIKKYKPKSHTISNSQVLKRNYSFLEAKVILVEMIDDLVLELIKKNLVTDKIIISIGYSNYKDSVFKIVLKFYNQTCSYREILVKVLKEYDYQVNIDKMIRKISIVFSNVTYKQYEQLSLFSLNNVGVEDDIKLEKTILEIKNKFGKNSILRAISYNSVGNQIKRNNML